MEKAAINKDYPFLKNGGEMGELTRNYGWEKTSLGTPDAWPQSLRTTLGIILHSAFPMLLFWGKDLTCFYNDAFRPSLGRDGKHPALGKKGEEVWSDIWDFIGPLIQGVIASGEPVYFEDQLVPFYRNGRTEDIYWTFSYSPAYGDDGQVNGVFVTCTETTDKVVSLRHLAESKNQLHFAVEASELATWDLDPITHKFTASPRLREWFSLPPDGDAGYKDAIAAIAEKDRQRVEDAITRALEWESGGHYEIEHSIINPANGTERIVRAVGLTQFDAHKVAQRFNGTIQDVTAERKAARALKDSEARFRSLIEEAPVGTCLYVGPEHRIEVANKIMLGYWGKGSAVLGKPLREALPELEGQPFLSILDEVFKTGKTYEQKAARAELVVNGVHGVYYFDVTYKPLRDANGVVYAILDTAVDVTGSVLAQQQIEESQRQLFALFEESPVGIATISRDDELVFKSANAFYGLLTGRAPADLIGRPLLKALPELQGQGFDTLLKNVITTGTPFMADEAPVHVQRNGRLDTIYINFTYHPHRGPDGHINGVLVVATDVTQQVLSRQKVEASETRLRTLIQSAPAAIGMFVGRDLIIENPNQTFIDVIACGPDIAGRSLKDLMPEQEHFLQIMEGVLTTGEPYIAYGAKLQIMRDGAMIERYFNVSFSPMRNEQGEVYAVLDVSIDITEQIIAQQKQEESAAQLRSLVESAPFPIGVYTGREMRIHLANQAIIDVYGKGNDIVGKLYTEILPELANQEIFDQLREVYDTGQPYHSGTRRVDLEHNGVLKPYYFNYSFTPLFDSDGKVYGIMNTAADVTVLETARLRAEHAEARLRGVIAAAPAGIGIFMGRDLIIENPNQTFIDIVGKGPGVEGLPLREAMPELLTEGQPFLKILDDVFTTGIPFISPASLVKIVQNGVLNDNYYNISYTPLHNAEGEVYAILDIAVDVTAQIKAQKQLEESELFARSIIDNSPVAKVVFAGPDMVITIVNQNMLAMLGRDETIIGKPFMDAMPELVPTPLMDRLRHVLATGETYYQPEEKIDLIKFGKPHTGYYNYIYKAMRNIAGEIYGVMTTATDVTAQVTARQQLEEAELNLRGAIELAQLGTWSIDVATNALTYSDRLIEWFGYDPADQNYQEVIPLLDQEDQTRVGAAVAWALNPASGGVYDEIYTVINARTGQKKILHAQGKTIFDPGGKPIRMNGTAQDITIQRELQLALESEVQERTEELAATNEELQATNEELAESNTNLIHSNEELAQYAYVASHDLQEPLRKIRVFSGILSGKDDLDAASREVVGKISGAAARMSMLISDLLEFSRLLKSETLMRRVDLNEILRAVTDDFELTIRERMATIEIDSLPVIDAVSLQMNQLFYNLLSNSLKFIAPDTQPHVTVKASLLSPGEAAKYISKPLPGALYYDIAFSDNGIGFEAKYAEQIFEVFKRLHGRDIYPGSGIGLSLCRRIAANHNGYLYAVSSPGSGTTFHIILPKSQS